MAHAQASETCPETCDVLIVGGGAAGIATAASLLRRRPGLDVVIVEPSERHYYQPGWTLVGAGVFTPERTMRETCRLIPKGARWIKDSVVDFAPEADQVRLSDGRRIGYRALVAAPGIKLDWDAIPGLSQTLGRNGVTSNYRFDLAPYTWKLVQEMKGGRALFTQPPMPIKCAGAPQKALYLSADHWQRTGALQNVDIEFHNAGAVLFGVKDYVPALMKYIERYGVDLRFNSRLTAIDGEARKATFAVTDADGAVSEVVRDFDMIHVCPPQTAPDFIRNSPLATDSGWIDVDQATLHHNRLDNVFGLGDACSAPNAKTAAAARKQAPVVAENVISMLDSKALKAVYDGYGSCPLTVERGKIVLAEFGYGGKLLPSFPSWMLDGRQPTRRLAPEGAGPAGNLLGRDAEGPRVAVRPRLRRAGRRPPRTKERRLMGEPLSLLQYGLGAGAGSLVGFTLGLVGGGGSILAVPLIVYLVGVKDPHLAIGTSAFAVAANAFANLLNHARHGSVKWKIALLFAAAGVVGAALGSSLGKAVDGQKLLALFAVLMLVVGALMLRGRSAAGDPNVTLTSRNTPKLIGTGTATGMLSGFFGIGGGFLIVPSLMGSTGMPIYYAVGSSLVGVTAFGLTTAFNYALAGWVNWALAAVFIGGGVLGGLAGARLAKTMSSRKGLLNTVFAGLIFVVALYMLYQSAQVLMA